MKFVPGKPGKNREFQNEYLVVTLHVHDETHVKCTNWNWNCENKPRAPVGIEPTDLNSLDGLFLIREKFNYSGVFYRHNIV